MERFWERHQRVIIILGSLLVLSGDMMDIMGVVVAGRRGGGLPPVSHYDLLDSVITAKL